MRRVRPALWLALGSVGVVAGLMFGARGAVNLLLPTELDGVPVCHQEVTEDCLERRDAEVVQERQLRYQWLSREREWLLDRAPQAGTGDRLEVTVPRQPGQDLVREGMTLTIVQYRHRPVLLELPGGTIVETVGHPRRYAPTEGYLGIGLFGLGMFAVRLGWHNGRARRWWRRVDYREPTVYWDVVLFVSGLAGLLTQYLVGASRWPAFIVAAVLLAGTGYLVSRVRRRGDA